MNKPRNLFLVGPMGAGKSAVGRQLARLLHLQFVDSDEEIEARTGVDIPFIFEKEGEVGFRKREVKVIDELSQRDGVVLATGVGQETQSRRSRSDALGSDFTKALEGPTAYEKDVAGVDLKKLLVGMFPATLRWHIGDATFDDLQ